jgi:hypothetical protein
MVIFLETVHSKTQCRVKACAGPRGSCGWGGWRLTLPETIKSGVFQYNSCYFRVEGPGLLPPLNLALAKPSIANKNDHKHETKVKKFITRRFTDNYSPQKLSSEGRFLIGNYWPITTHRKAIHRNKKSNLKI